jgi:soluble lytic murein transglycosylase-like protein
MLLPLLIILPSLTTPAQIAAVIDSTVRSDSVQASRVAMLPYSEHMVSIGARYTVPASLLAAIVQEESRFDQWAVRTEPHYKRKIKVIRDAERWSLAHAGVPSLATEIDDRARSIGLMQVMGEVAREQGYSARFLSQLHEPEHGIEQGAILLRRLLTRYRSDTLSAISAYNQGDNRRKNGVFLNARYVYRVTIAWQAYRKILDR